MRRVAPKLLSHLGLGVAAALLVLFCFYIGNLYHQLEAAFSKREQFIPTRIYSDVYRIAPPATRDFVQDRLTALGYGSQAQTTGNAIEFKLHPIQYPDFLIPENHPTLDFAARGQKLQLEFDGVAQDSTLVAIRAQDSEIPEIYLEPELVATLSRGESQKNDQVRELVHFGEIPAPIWKAIIAIEDQHFLDHHGVDPRGLLRAVWVNLKSRRLAQGGSTITQQLVKNLMARRTKNIFQKVNELFLTVLLELRYEKEQILERYLNEVYLGQIGNLEIHGVAEGAKHFFGKRLEELNLGEIAMMAGLIRGPAYYSPYRQWDRALERQKLVLKKMAETGQLSEAESQEAGKLPVRLAPPVTTANKAPYFVDFVKAELIRQLKDRMTEEEITQAGLKIYSTLHVPMNQAAQRAVARGIDQLENSSKAPLRIEGALASVDHSTGFLRALVGGKDYARSTFNRILNMKRQVGSTFKPIVYLTALTKRTDSNGVPYGPGYPMEDAPWTLNYDHGRQAWSPKNYEPEFKGWITLRQALAHSTNTVAARLGHEVGIQKVIETARELGIESPLPEVPSLALGVAELSPVELLKAYATIAHHGVQDELTAIRAITADDGSIFARFVYHPKLIFEPGPADLVSDMMTSVFNDGTATPTALRLNFTRPAAGKTGTTSNHRDSWFAGFTPQLTAVVWVGIDPQGTAPATPTPPSPSQKKGKVVLTGASAALPIWIDFMKTALADEPPSQFPISTHLKRIRIDRHSGRRASAECPDPQLLEENYLEEAESGDSACQPNYPNNLPSEVRSDVAIEPGASMAEPTPHEE